MSQVTNCKYRALVKALGQAGHIDDLESLWLISEGAASDHVNNQWMEVFIAGGATSDNWNDAANEYLIGLGAPFQSLPNNWQWFWCTYMGGELPIGDLPVWAAALSPYMLDGSNSTPEDHIYSQQLLGVGVPAFVTPIGLALPDFENVYRETATANEMPVYGARKVTNYILHSNDFTLWDGSAGFIDTGRVSLAPDGSDARIFELDVEGWCRSPDTTITIGSDVVSSCWIRANQTGTMVIKGGETKHQFEVTTDWQRVTGLGVVTTSSFRKLFFDNRVSQGGSGMAGLEISMWHGQLEQIDGQSNQNPSEYISTTDAERSLYFTNLNGNTVTSNVVDETVLGAPLAVIPSCFGNAAVTNSCLFSRDGTNAAWIKASMSATFDEVGLTGEPNTATALTATGGNATILQTVTAASGEYASRFFLKRKTGTGVVEITVDGSTWTAVTLTSDYEEFLVDQAAVTNPQVGVRIVTSGDAVVMGQGECHL